MTAPASAKFSVFAERGDRLTSRLEGLLSVWRFARSLERNAVVFWPPRREDDYPSSTIFDLPAMARDPACSDLTLVDQKYIPREEILDLGTTPDWPDRLQRAKLLGIDRNFFVRSQSNIQYEREKQARIDAEKKSLYGLLRPHPLVSAQLTEAMNWIGPGGFVAIHLRRGDLITTTELMLRRYESRARPKKPVPAEDVAKAEMRLKDWIGNFVLRAAPAEAYRDALRLTSCLHRKRPRVIIFSDSEPAALEFQERNRDFPTLLMSSFKADLTEIQRAYLEVLILCRARRIISTRSTFGKFAGFYGNVPFTDVRHFTSREEMRVFFRQCFSAQWQKSPQLEAKCEELLKACLGRGQTSKTSGVGPAEKSMSYPADFLPAFRRRRLPE